MLNRNEKLNVEVMSLEELDQVSGGTVGEFEDILKAFSKYDMLKTISGISTHVPGANKLTVELVQDTLREIGIEAEIDLGFLGTGIGSKKNKYLAVGSGRSLSHSEVLERIKQASDSAYKQIGL